MTGVCRRGLVAVGSLMGPHQPVADLEDFDAAGSEPGLSIGRKSIGAKGRHDLCREVNGGQAAGSWP